MMTRILLALVGLGLAIACNPARAANITVTEGRYPGEKYVSIQGKIESGDLERVIKASATAIFESSSTLALLLNSNGGDVSEAMRIGRFARKMLATTYVYGNTLYYPDSPLGQDMESVRQYPQMRFSLRPITRGEPIEEKVVACYSACVTIFYGGVNRYASDNLDGREGRRSVPMKPIPVIGIHRPYFDPKLYATFSPDEAKKKYASLENAVREYMMEMGAPASAIDRIFAKSSLEVELVPSETFKSMHRDKEPFYEEWMIAKCGGYGPNSALSSEENMRYQHFDNERKKAVLTLKLVAVEKFNQFVPDDMSRAEVDGLEHKIKAHNEAVMACRNTAVKRHQLQWAASQHN